METEIGVLNNANIWNEYAKDLDTRQPLFVYVIASTKTSTIPGISVAGASPEATLYTPTLDIEYLVYGSPKTLDVIPVTPEGIPTPALITRAALSLVDVPYIIVDAGTYKEPLVPHVVLPHRVVGNRIDVENALPSGYAEKLFRDGETLGRMIATNKSFILIGESMPGGTTTAMAIMESLGFKAIGRVSSASPNNPHNLKVEVFKKAVSRYGKSLPVKDVFEAVEVFGDPLHISIAGIAYGALEKGAKILLAGGTQMCSVLAILKRLGAEMKGRLAIGTTRWIIEDKTSDIIGLVKDIAPETIVIYTKLSFSDAPYTGLKFYEQGYVKEGVGAGGTVVATKLLFKVPLQRVKEAIYEEYKRVLGLGLVKKH